MDEKSMFIMYFCGLVSMQYHPKNFGVAIDLDKFADIAQQMVCLTRERYPED